MRMDDILISGKDDNNHIANLEAVLKKLSEAGLRLGCGCEKKSVSSWCRKSPIVVMRSMVVVSSQ